LSVNDRILNILFSDFLGSHLPRLLVTNRQWARHKMLCKCFLLKDKIINQTERHLKGWSRPPESSDLENNQSCRSLTIWWSTLSILITWNLWSIRSNRSIVYEVINRWSILLKSLTKTLYFWNDSTVHQNNYKSCYTVISCYF
jgi:hypothetical protein